MRFGIWGVVSQKRKKESEREKERERIPYITVRWISISRDRSDDSRRAMSELSIRLQFSAIRWQHGREIAVPTSSCYSTVRRDAFREFAVDVSRSLY